ncbi:histidine kinase [Actinoplanes sp. SE50]|uniref:HAMP domain-containing sensor histidine kinase n=1 Tax=unclassified Actinoplanes TaxID=2626549 RepID=UPI00023EC9C0|nr:MULTISPECIES: ATP-binding protein [unclassified Actinoplanes]AEV85951.1 histidine kinase [Actinoplanes sp. SE50/110]ATO84349.1 histidine kinase [Actinoplanes sp. SE50]SLM01759.1 signal transduction histidine kinase [Actinoplanes sp. SE50/110]
MSFRLRIFLLVLVVAGTAIGATAWLTLSLTSRELSRLNAARDRHKVEITTAIRRFGLTNGQWTGIDAVVAQLSRRTGLHIRVEGADITLADSDVIRGQAVGPVQLQPISIEPFPGLDPDTQADAVTIAQAARADPNVITTSDLKRLNRSQVEAMMRQRPALPAGLFTVTPRTSGLTTPEGKALLQLAQYRAGLVAVRCAAERHELTLPQLGTEQLPFLTPEQLTTAADCVRAGRNRVFADTGWLDEWWQQFVQCRSDPRYFDQCLEPAFAQGASSTSGIPVKVYFGAGRAQDLQGLGRPAVFGAAGLLVAAALGTAWVARRVSRPVRALTGASLQLAAGQLDVRVPAGGKDELAFLSASFNAMAEAVQRSEERQRRLVADVAHELRTPLSNLRGYLEGLADGVIEPTPELFASLHEETLLQRRILDDLQMLALAEAGDLAYHPEPLDLTELAETSVTAHRANAANAGLELILDAPEPVLVTADPDRIRQVLGNLLSNAIRYTDAGGRVEVGVSRDPLTAILTVADTGVGMTAAEVSRVFDRFWRADPARQRTTGGSGLGLTIARRIVDDHGGNISAASEPGLGTTFTVRLPAEMR